MLALLAQAQPMLRKLDPVTRAQVFMALLGLILLGLLLILVVMVGGHYVRRLARHRPATTSPQDLWYRKPLVPESPEASDEGP